MKKLLMATLVTGLMVCGARGADAQGLSLSLRGGGGLALGDFASAPASEGNALAGAKNGFGLGLDAALSFTRSIGLYAGFDRIAFACEDTACGRDGEYNLSGFTAGLQLTPVRVASLTPWVRGGVTFNQLRGTYGAAGNKLSSDRAPGYEVGAGIHVPVLGVLALSPQVRYVGQSPRVRIPGVDAPEAATEIGYFTFDLGLSVQAPFGR
jgi:hypothetical protein